eukprot:4544838-Pleurochrysis_carterae.AAC.1
MERDSAKAELLRLATEPARASPLLNSTDTPFFHDEAFRWLFVGFAYNLELESMVSRLTMLEHRHPKMHAITLD